MAGNTSGTISESELHTIRSRPPFKIRMPTKLGFKNPKWVTTIYVTNRYPGGFWPDRGYNWFSGL